MVVASSVVLLASQVFLVCVVAVLPMKMVDVRLIQICFDSEFLEMRSGSGRQVWSFLDVVVFLCLL